MDQLWLFTDGSVDEKSKIGYGAYLAVIDPELLSESIDLNVELKRFENTSSSKLELQTLLWALGEIDRYGCPVIVYTDSQNIVGLTSRRGKIQRNDYRSNTGKLLTNHELYRTFFKLMDKIECSFEKVKGHQQSDQKHKIDRLFTIVDRASRKTLRKELLGK